MSVTQLAGPFGEWRVATAGTGAAIAAAATTPAQFVAFPPGSHYVVMEGRNYTSSATVIRWSLNPWLTIIKTTDDLATSGNATDYSEYAQDGDAATDVTLSSFASSHALWVGAELPFRGVYADVDGANASAATMAATYWNGSTMTSLTITDGTASGGNTFAVDGGVTWTVPTDWAVTDLRTAASAVVGIPHAGAPKYWVRFKVNATLDSAVTLNALTSMNRSTASASLVSGREMAFLLGTGSRRHGCIEAITDAGTAQLIVNVATQPGGMFR